MSQSLMKRAALELVGTFILITAATSVIINGKVSFMGIALSPAIAVAFMIIAIGPISGVHLNPAVSFAFLLAKRMSFKDFLAYVLAQVLGSLLAAFSIRAIFTQRVAGQFNNGVTSLAPGVTFLLGFIIETVLTFILVVTIFIVTDPHRNLTPHTVAVSIAGVIVVQILAFGTTTGASFNPVRWLGPAVASGYFTNAALYLLSPFIGGALAVIAQRYLSSDPGHSPA
jgi:aquaporin Z